ncbi:MAG: hypothetical protein JXB29_12405 [Sedimentisphaerales bacterium]|nr:hypothetical protein [Sedimentisphaerales bacterium]
MAGGCGAYDFGKEGYLTWGDKNVGVTPYSKIREVIKENADKVTLISRARTYIEGVDGYYDSVNRDSSYPKNQRKRQLQYNLNAFGYIGFIQQDFENYRPLEEKGLLDFNTDKKRFAIGDGRYYASKNTSPGLASFFTEDTATGPALIDVPASPLVYGTVAYMDKDSIPLKIYRRSGRDWPDEKITSGTVKISLDIYRKLDSAFVIKASGADSNPQIMFDPQGRLNVMENGKWLQKNLSITDNTWTKLFVEINFNTEKYIVTTDSDPENPVALSFDKENIALDGLTIKSLKADFCLDNINMTWSW